MQALAALPVRWYIDSEWFRDERATVFGCGWQYVGDGGTVAAPGTFVAADLGGRPIVMTRDVDGRLHALANVCRHRGAVIAVGGGSRRTLQCPYHGWTYRLDGCLHRTPGMDVAAGVRLPELGVDVAGPLLFARTRAEGESVAEVLAPFLAMVKDVAGLELAALRRRASIAHVIEANWKVVVENFIECYHCPLVHATTLPGYGGDDYLVGQAGPLHTQRLEADRFCFAYLFPNTQLSAYGSQGAFVARALLPDGPARTRITLDFWFADDIAEAEATAFIEWFDKVVGEDIPLCESVQRGLESGFFEQGFLNPTGESGLAAFQELLTDAMAGVAR
jgi:phenylpropionate dioxygenase-like ring-hydroxylating dioxygenase large terminal subunit